MGKSILITGGARSGKSVFAEGLVASLGESPLYIATAEIHDDEMQARVSQHQARRGSEWKTFHAPRDLAQTLIDTDGHGPRLVDCLTLWLSNIMFADLDVAEETEKLAETLCRQSSPVVLVTNEVGDGIVPENAVARRFRDLAGSTNQRIASIADEVYLVVAGCPLKVKPT